MHNQKRSFKQLMAVLGTAGMGALLSFPALAQVNSNPSGFNEAPSQSQPSTSPEGSNVLEQCVSESTQTSSQSSYQTGMNSSGQSMTSSSVPNSGLYRVGSSDRSAMADVEAIGPSGMEFSSFASRSSVNPYESITPTGGTSGGHALQRYEFLAFENEAGNTNRSNNQASINNSQPEAGIPIEGQNRGEYTQRQNEIGQAGYNNSTLSQGTTAESNPIYRVSPSDVNSPSSSMDMQRSSSSTTSYNVCR